MDNIKHEFVKDSDIPKEYQEHFDNLKNAKPDINAVPDLNLLLEHMYEILSFFTSSKGKKLLSTQRDKLILQIADKYESVPISMIKILADEKNRKENVERLLNMLSLLQQAKDGVINIDDVQKNISDDLNKQYIYNK